MVSRYHDVIFIIHSLYYEDMDNQIFLSEQLLHKASSSYIESQFLNFHLSIINWFVSSKIYDKPDGFDIVIYSSFGCRLSPCYHSRGLHVSTYSVCKDVQSCDGTSVPVSD